MRISEICRDIGRRLKGEFPESLAYVENITHGAEGNFLLVITEISDGRGIVPRKKRSVSFDIVYFSKLRDTLGFADWAERMEKTFGTLSADGQIFHTSARNAVRTDMQFHYMFTVSADFIEYSTETPEMGVLEGTYGIKNE